MIFYSYHLVCHLIFHALGFFECSLHSLASSFDRFIAIYLSTVIGYYPCLEVINYSTFVRKVHILLFLKSILQ